MESDDDQFSPPLLIGLQRGDSNRSWTTSQELISLVVIIVIILKMKLFLAQLNFDLGV
jgi:hypothetical protein